MAAVAADVAVFGVEAVVTLLANLWTENQVFLSGGYKLSLVLCWGGPGGVGAISGSRT